MNEAPSDSALSSWRVPECPFAIEYAPRVLEDIRLAVADAFFSLPRGGVEIGGILMGQWQAGRLRVTGHAQLDCEHAHGPSFTLSGNDQDRLRALLSHAPANVPDLLPVGWYHSHTRSEIFLSEADLAVHDRFFREPWHIALVLRPHMMQPTRGGFFFRDASGSIHAEASYQEFSLEAPPIRQVSRGPLDIATPEDRPRTVRLERNSAVAVSGEPSISPASRPPMQVPPAKSDLEPEPVRRTETDAAVADVFVPPSFLMVQQPSRGWLAPLLIVCAAAAVGAAAYNTHQAWLPKVMAAVQPSPAALDLAPPLHFTAIDRDGQLQITWDPNVQAMHDAVKATLEIDDGSQVPHEITLDQAHLHNGFFTYARQSERVDMKLILHRPDGTQVREVTTFLGALPERRPAEEDPEVRKQRDELAVRASKLQTELDRQAAVGRKLERDLQDMRDEIRKQQQHRMNNMLPDGK